MSPLTALSETEQRTIPPPSKMQSTRPRAAGGGTIEIPPAAGNYLCGPITLSSNMNFQVDAGATLQALPFGTYPKSLTSPSHFITLANGSTNVEMSGQGTIDGKRSAVVGRLQQFDDQQSAEAGADHGGNEPAHHWPHLSQSSPSFHIAFDTTTNVTIFGVTINTFANSPNHRRHGHRWSKLPDPELLGV